jgi:23S rRNA pseudouridine1911/1915/1917 synthase
VNSPPKASEAEVGEGTFVVTDAEAGWMLDRFVRTSFGQPPWSKVRSAIEQGRVLVDGKIERTATRPLTLGSKVQVGRHRFKSETASEGNSNPDDFVLLHSDSQVVVVDKPSGISTEPYDASEKDTLLSRLMKKFRSKIHVVHRLDKETSGVLVFARTTVARDHLKNQFRFRTTGRNYVALVHGTPKDGTIRSRLVRDRGDGLRGSTDHPTLGRDATTHIEVLRSFSKVSLIRCRLETGRTHQIRIHLGEAGHPLLGERVYSRDFEGEIVPAPRIMLHAQSLTFQHPVSGEKMDFECNPPLDFRRRLEELEAQGGYRARAP